MARTEELTIAMADGHDMPASLALPVTAADPVPGVLPGVLVVHEIFGLNDDIRRIAARFADNGYAALAPDLFARGPKILCVARTMRQLRAGTGEAFDDMDAARSWLAGREEVDGSRIGAAGFCFGGGFVLMYAVRAPVGAIAPFYGDVPKEAERLRGIPPVVASFGGRDRVMKASADRLPRHLESLGVPHDVKVYPEAGHSFMSDHEGTLAKISARGPMKAAFDPEASEDAWSRVLSFFGEHLGAQSVDSGR